MTSAAFTLLFLALEHQVNGRCLTDIDLCGHRDYMAGSSDFTAALPKLLLNSLDDAEVLNCMVNCGTLAVLGAPCCGVQYNMQFPFPEQLCVFCKPSG